MMQAIRSCVPLLLVGALFLVEGYVHGVWTNRWTVSQQLELAARRLEQVPVTVGAWQGEALEPLRQREVEQAGFAGHVTRRYRNRQTGGVITVLLACGRSGPISVHTPDVCYRGSGYEQVGVTAKHVEKSADGGVAGELWKTQFQKADSPLPTQLRLFWAWNAAGSWKAATNPRLTFGGAPALYKLYVIHEIVPGDAATERIGFEFLSQVLPALNKSLFPS